jgi:hypothetical protein
MRGEDTAAEGNGHDLPKMRGSTAMRRGRKVLFGVLLAFGVWIVAEVASAVALLTLAQSCSPAELRRRQQECAGLRVTRGALQDARLLSQTTAREVLHPYLGFVGDVDRNHELVAVGAPTFSAFGFRDTSSPLSRRSDDRLIIAVTGGSVAGLFTRHGSEALADLLRDCPRLAGRSLEFVNLALGGYKQPQQLMTLCYLLALGAEFDVVIQIDGFNEVALHGGENEKHGTYPIFPRGWARRVATLPDPVQGLLRGRISYLNTERKRLARRAQDWPPLFSALLYWHLRDSGLQNSLNEGEASLRAYSPSQKPYVATGPFEEQSSQDLYSHLAEIWQRCSLQMHQLCQAQGIEFFHFLQPNQYLPGSKPMNAEERKRALLETHAYNQAVQSGYPLLRERGEQLFSEGVHFHDLSQIFAAHEEPLYIDTCCHLNERGNEIMAGVIAATLLEVWSP